MKFVFVGTSASAGARSFQQYGQVHDIEEKEAVGFLTGGVSIVPLDLFKMAGFTVEELQQFRHPGTWPGANAAGFNAKRSVFNGVFQAFRKVLEGEKFNEAVQAVLRPEEDGGKEK